MKITFDKEGTTHVTDLSPGDIFTYTYDSNSVWLYLEKKNGEHRCAHLTNLCWAVVEASVIVKIVGRLKVEL